MMKKSNVRLILVVSLDGGGDEVSGKVRRMGMQNAKLTRWSACDPF